MLRRSREYGPVFLVPLAWAFTTAVHLDLAGTTAVLIAHLVMDVCLLAFVITGWTEMREGALRAWRAIIGVGLVITLVGTAGVATTPVDESLAWVSLVGWMVLPAAGLVYTGWLGAAGPRIYYAGGALSAVGAVLFVVAAALSLGTTPTLVGLGLVGAGQTAGIANAAVQS